MAKIVLTIHYEIDVAKREEYLACVQQLKTHYGSNQQVVYSVYEQKGKKNAFVEMFVALNEDVFKQFEETDDEVADALATKLTEFMTNGKMKYTTYIETI